MKDAFFEKLAGILSEEYHNCRKSFRVISLDTTNGEHLCHSQRTVYCYDDIIKKVFAGRELPMSPDGLFLDSLTHNIIFIEFKNGRLRQENKIELRFKGVEGIYSLLKWILKDFSLLPEEQVDYIVVYNRDKISDYPTPDRDNIVNYIGKLAQERQIKFGLSRLKGTYFNDVITMNQDEFDQRYG
jgi:hypothetical protein